ncbi:MAG: hypothetical protein V4578_19040 [Pseudomonadota bacterium]
MHVLARNNLDLRKVFANLGVAALLSTALAACSMPTTVMFANATNRGVAISYKDDSHKIATLAVAPNSVVEVKHLLDVHFSIRTAESVMNYEREVVPGTYIEDIGFGPFSKRVVKAQLENDGCVYLLAGKDDIPNRRHEVQPDGFPLCPGGGAPASTSGRLPAQQ